MSELQSALLVDRVKIYCHEHDASDGYAKLLRYNVTAFSTFLGHPALIEDLTKANLDNWGVYLAEKGLSPFTVRSYTRGLGSLWHDAFEAGLIETQPTKLRRVKLPRRNPVAWATDEVEQLLTAAEKLKGFYPNSGVARRSYWIAWIRLQFDSALRFSDMCRLRCNDVVGLHRFTVLQQKTGDAIVVQLHPSTVEAVRLAAEPAREFLFGGAICRDWIFAQFRKLVTSAGLSTEHGLSHRLRRASATAVEQAQPGAAMRHLGHRTPGLAYKHYVDANLVQLTKAMPPELGTRRAKGGAA